ncbi:hypothetical protein MMC11_002402 [Xylographa trunciseda]|nr:hypothetical protein [Xylographa trunciseda]
MNSGSGEISSASIWQCDNLTFSFEPQTTTRAPRAWDREPKAPSVPTHKGRIVWKRYGLRSTDVANVQIAPLELGSSQAAIYPRDVKRLCLKPTYGFQPLVQARKQTQYLATLQDKVLGTPRRKATERRNLRLQTLDSSFLTTDSIDSSSVCNKDEMVENQIESEEVRGGVGDMSPDDETQQLYQLPKSVDVENPLILRPLENDITTQTREEQPWGFELPINIIILGESPSNKELLQQLILSSDDSEEDKGIKSENLAISVEMSTSEPFNLLAAHTVRTTERISEVSLEGESHNLSELSTHAREISPPQKLETTITALVSSDHIPQDTRKILDNPLSRPFSNVFDQSSTAPGTDGAVSEDLEEPSRRNAKLAGQTTKDGSKGIQEALDSQNLQLLLPEPTSPVTQSDASNKLGNARGTRSISPDIQNSNPMRQTRSGARYSDDTNMLKDFLNRANAKKAAKSKEIAVVSCGDQSPRRSPRKVLGQLDRNSPSPIKSRDPITCIINNPPENDSLDLPNGDNDNDELCGESKSHRRSARTCTIMPEKNTLGTLCLIPVRRPDGPEPIVLQRSAAQELANTTRANTRRNKGLSKLPRVMLETLAGAIIEDAPVKKHETRAAKSVEWDKKLVYFQQSVDREMCKEKKEGKAEGRPKTRRLKEPGAVSGTPAPKRVLDIDYPSNGTPAPKRRGKRKS